MSFDNSFFEPEEESDDENERVKNDGEKEENVEEMSDEELVEMIQDRDNIENIPEDSCSRYEVCGNTCMSNTCVECWEDIRRQLETPDGGCPDCDNQYFKYLPAGEEVGLRCKKCGFVEWQTIEYSGKGEQLSDWEKARRDLQ